MIAGMRRKFEEFEFPPYPKISALEFATLGVVIRQGAGTRVSRDEKETGRTREKERDTVMERRAEEKREVSMPGVTIGLPPTATRYALPGDGVGVLGLRPLDAISSLPIRSIRQRTFKPST